MLNTCYITYILEILSYLFMVSFLLCFHRSPLASFSSSSYPLCDRYELRLLLMFLLLLAKFRLPFILFVSISFHFVMRNHKWNNNNNFFSFEHFLFFFHHLLVALFLFICRVSKWHNAEKVMSGKHMHEYLQLVTEENTLCYACVYVLYGIPYTQYSLFVTYA